MSFSVSPFPPIVAFGIDSEKTLTATPAEGSTVIELPNSSNVIAVRDPVFIRSSDETVLQYRGRCTVSGATQITVRIPLQDAVGSSATAWKPTNSIIFTGEVRWAQRPTLHDGSRTIVNFAGIPLNYQIRDSRQTLDMSFHIHSRFDSGVHNFWLDFGNTNRRGFIDPFNLGYYDFSEDIAKTVKVLAEAGEHTMTVVNNFRVSFSQRFHVIADNIYVES